MTQKKTRQTPKLPPLETSRPELLAPAGGMTQLKAAVENGADAVYMGGKLFNARINAENFSDEEMQEAIAYAHIKGVKLYITMNTLFYDEELIPALLYAAKLYEWGADALILQNLGFAHLVRTYLPQMPLHLSTQGTIYNAEGVKAAAQLGFSRVVLARELALNEIQTIASENIVQLEVFVHGALCMCYSGQCQLSNEIGGRSGNRGLCAQPCRLPYQLIDQRQPSSKQKLGHCQQEQSNVYALSPKDLCLIEHLGELVEAGVHSFKIEGRMKSAEYVAVVTRLYRKYLDEYLQNGHYAVCKEDIQELKQIFNRGGFTNGYLYGNPGETLLSGNLPKHQGIYIGKVKRVAPKRGLLDVEIVAPIALGDGVEVRNQFLPGNVVTYLQQQSDRLVTIGDIKGKVQVGDAVYKITDHALMKRAQKSYEGKSWQEEKQLRKVKVNAFFHGEVDEPAVLILRDQDGNEVKCQSLIDVQRATNKSIDAALIEKQLQKTGGTPFQLTETKIVIGENLSLPVASINQMRREALSILAEKRAGIQSVVRDENHEQMKAQKQEQVRKIDPKQLQQEAQRLIWNRGKIPAITAEPAIQSRRASETESQNNTIRQYKTQPVQRALYLYEGCELPSDEENTQQTEQTGSFDRIYLPYDVLIEEIWNELEYHKSPKFSRYGSFQNYAQTVQSYQTAGIQLIPVIPNVTKGEDDRLLRKYLNKVMMVAQKNGIMVGNICWLKPFIKAGIVVYGDYGLNISNSADFLLMSHWGLKGAVLSQDTPEEQIKHMEFHGLETELAIEGQNPVMVTEHCILKDFQLCKECEKGSFYLKDRKNEIFRIISNCRKCKSVIISCKNHKPERKQNLLREITVNTVRKYGK